MRFDFTWADRTPLPETPAFHAALVELWALTPETLRQPAMAQRLSPGRPEIVWTESWQRPAPWAEVAGQIVPRVRGPKPVVNVPVELIDRLMADGGPWGLERLSRLPGLRVGTRTGEHSLGWMWDRSIETLEPGSAWNPLIDTLWQYRGLPHAWPLRADAFPTHERWGSGPIRGWLQRLPHDHPALLQMREQPRGVDLTQMDNWTRWLIEEIATLEREEQEQALRRTTCHPVRHRLILTIPQPWTESTIQCLGPDEQVVRLRTLPPELRTQEEGERAWQLVADLLSPTAPLPLPGTTQLESWARQLLDVAVTYRPQRPDLVAVRAQLVAYATTPATQRPAELGRMTDALTLQAGGLAPWICDSFTLPTSEVTEEELDQLWRAGAPHQLGLLGRIAGHPAIPSARGRAMLVELAEHRTHLASQIKALAGATQQIGYWVASPAARLVSQLDQLDHQLRDTTRLWAARPDLEDDPAAARAWATLAPLDEGLRLLTRLGPTHGSTSAVVEGMLATHPIDQIAKHLLNEKWAPLAPLIPPKRWRPLLLSSDRDVRLLAARVLGQAETMQQEGALAEPLPPQPPRKKIRRLSMTRVFGDSLP